MVFCAYRERSFRVIERLKNGELIIKTFQKFYNSLKQSVYDDIRYTKAFVSGNSESKNGVEL